MTAQRGLIEVGGRRVEYDARGPAGGDAVVFHTGTPSGGLLFDGWVQAGVARGIRHVAYSRPGYGASDRRPGRTVADCAQDVAAVADELGIGRFYAVGWSGGGPHALACAALLGDRVVAAATLAGVAPYRAEGLNWLAGMGDENVAEFAAAEAGESALTEFLEAAAEEIVGAEADQLREALGGLLTDVDREALTGAVGKYMVQSTDVGLGSGISGWLDDDLAFIADWGFELGAIAAPVTIWQGERDRMVPFAHGPWLAGHVAAARARLLPEEGHLSLVVNRYGDVLDELIAPAE